MMQRILDALRLSSGQQATMPHLRPNELRREVVQAERRRREAAVAPIPGVEQERPRHEGLPTKPPAAHVLAQAAFPGVLKTRAGLRQALLMKEILDPPVGMRGPDRDR